MFESRAEVLLGSCIMHTLVALIQVSAPIYTLRAVGVVVKRDHKRKNNFFLLDIYA